MQGVTMPRFYNDFDIYLDTVVVAATETKFYSMAFSGQYWSAIEIAEDIRPWIKYVAFYLTDPHCAIMYVAKVNAKDMQRSSDEEHKWVLHFAEPVEAITHIHRKDHSTLRMRHHQYTNSKWMQQQTYVEGVLENDNELMTFLIQTYGVPPVGVLLNAPN
jgi:hypothetical protein